MNLYTSLEPLSINFRNMELRYTLPTKNFLKVSVSLKKKNKVNTYVLTTAKKYSIISTLGALHEPFPTTSATADH